VDYALACGPSFGWLCAILWGEKGSGKSNMMLQHGYSIFHGFDETEEIGKKEDGTPITRGVILDWDDEAAWKSALDHTVFRPKDFARLLSLVLDEKKRLTWVGWDDINIHFPRSMYSTNRKVWEQFSKNWEGFRANLSVFECSAPRKDKVVSFVLSDMNFDVLVSARQRVEVNRWFWDKDLYEPEKVLKMRIDVDSDVLDLTHTPKAVWEEYWKRKVQLIDESTEDFKGMLEDIDKPEGGGKPAPEAFICDVCGRDLGNAYNLRVHRNKHAPEIKSLTPP
jgi:hypothetical protein